MKLNNLNYVLINHLDPEKKAIVNPKNERVTLKDILLGTLCNTRTDDIEKGIALYRLILKINDASNEVELTSEEAEQIKIALHKNNAVPVFGSAYDVIMRELTE